MSWPSVRRGRPGTPSEGNGFVLAQPVAPGAGEAPTALRRSGPKCRSRLPFISSGASSCKAAAKARRFSRCCTASWRSAGEETRRPIRHLFLFIGAKPNSDWLSGCVKLDPEGFVLTGESCSTERQLLETSRRGVFAIGDVRAGSVKRVAAAGDELHVESEILEVRPSKSRPNQGVIKVRTTTFNQNDEPVQVQIGNLLVPARPRASSELI